MDVDAFRRDGAVRRAGLFGADGIAALAALASEGPGQRLRAVGLSTLIAPATTAARALIGQNAWPVRAVLFDKTPEAN